MARSTVVKNETAVGAFALLVIVVLGGLLFVKGAKIGFGARHVFFKASAGHNLKQGAVVKMQGIEVGEVEDVDLEKDNSVHVHLKIFPQFKDNVHEDATASIVEPPVLGSTDVELTAGTAGAGPIRERQDIRPLENEGLMTQVNLARDDIQKTLHRVNEIADKVGSIVDRVDKGQGIAGRLVTDEKLAQDFVKGVGGVVELVDEVKSGKGAFALLKDENLAPDLRAVVADVRSMTDAVARGDGSIGRLMTNATIVTEGEGVLKDVRGALARLEEITEDTKKTTAKVQEALDSAKGTLEKLDGTIKNAEKVTAQLAEISEKINKGQGTLAKLVNDDQVYKETKALLKELRESVEDLREQAPINAFIGVVFSAF